MKTIILKSIILTVFTVLSFSTVNAEGLKVKPEKKSLSSLVKKHITFPEVAQQNDELNKYSDYSGLVGQNLLYRFKFNLE